MGFDAQTFKRCLNPSAVVTFRDAQTFKRCLNPSAVVTFRYFHKKTFHQKMINFF
jgi:hypothetical protein